MLLRAYSISMNAKMTPEQRSVWQRPYASCHERTTLRIICILPISQTNTHSQWKIKEQLLKSHQGLKQDGLNLHHSSGPLIWFLLYNPALNYTENNEKSLGALIILVKHTESAFQETKSCFT